MKTSEEIYKSIDNIIENFDFESVHHFMKLTKHSWVNHTNNDMEVPSVDKIKNTSYNLLYRCYEQKANGVNSYSCGTGGFYAYLFEYGIKLSFEFKSYSSF